MPRQDRHPMPMGSSANMPREAHRPYRYGMTLLCFGGLLNWLGLFENYAEPVRYIGVACVVSGAMLLCFAICCWLRPGAHRDNADTVNVEDGGAVHVIAVAQSPASASKPPDYESVTDKPPSYEDAIKLSPSLLWLADEVHGVQRSPPQVCPGAGEPDQEVPDVSRVQDDAHVDRLPADPQPATDPSLRVTVEFNTDSSPTQGEVQGSSTVST